MTSRLDEIRKFVEMDPEDPFPRYALAMEYRQQGALDEAHEAFLDLRRRHPGYVAQYLMHGNLLLQMKRPGDAREAFEAGAQVAEKAGSHHALGELRGALGGLQSDDEDD